jgi:hypothetical protein
MPDLSTSIREYYDAAAEPIDIAEILARSEHRRVVPNWVVAVAAGLAVFVLIGGFVWLISGTSSEVIEEPMPTVVATTTANIPDETPVSVPDAAPPVTVSVLPESSTPAAIDETSAVAVSDGSLWAATQAGIVRWNLEDRSAGVFTSTDGLPNAEFGFGQVAVASDGTVWAFTWSQDVVGFDGTRWVEPDGYDQLDIVNPRCVVGEECLDPITAIAIGPDNLVSLAVGPETLLQFDGTDWNILPVSDVETHGDGASAWATDIDVASDGTLWIASWEELLAYDGDEWARFTTADGLPSGAINSVAVAPNGEVWVGTIENHEGESSGGVARFNGDAWTTFDETDGLYASAVTALAIGPDGSVWAVHGANNDPSAGLERAAGGISRFDGTIWSATTIADVGMGFGWGGAAVDDTGTLWVTSRWGVVGFNGAETTVLRVPEGTRPVIEVPHVVVEGGEDILATTVAKATAPVATCPAGSSPNQPGPVERARPPESVFSPVAMDHQSGRVVALVPAAGYGQAGVETWTYDVCANTWTQMNQPDFHQTADRPPSVLVYDADSDLVVAVGASVDAYDVDTDTWERHGDWPFGRSDEAFPDLIRAVYDPVSGLIVVRHIGSSELWAYDVDTDVWTPIRQGSMSPPGEDSGAWGQVHAYDASADRIVLFLADDGLGGSTWTFDLRVGEWSIERTVTPNLHVGAWWSPLGKAAYDEPARRTVITADGVVAGYDAAQHAWEILWESSSEPTIYGSGTGPHHRLGDHIVYDPTNDRIVVIGGEARMLDEDPFWVSMDDVWAFDTGTGMWTQLLAPPTP